MGRPAALMVAIALVSSACAGGDGGADGGDGPGETSSPTTPAAERPASTATLAIDSPANGEIVRGGPVELVLTLEGAELTDVTSTDLRPDQGHLHVTVDGQLISMTSGLSAPLPDLEDGSHLVTVEFVANDHAPFEPRVLAATTFEVRG